MQIAYRMESMSKGNCGTDKANCGADGWKKKTPK